MAPPPLTPPPLLPPLLPPSPRPSLQVSAGFSSANLPPAPLPHFPTLSVSCCYHHLTAATQACPPHTLIQWWLLWLHDQQSGFVLSPVHHYCLSGLTQLHKGKCSRLKTIISMLEQDRRRNHNKTVWNTVCQHCNHLQPACSTSPANHPADSRPTLHFSWRFSREHLTLSAFSVRVGSVGAERLTCAASVPWSSWAPLSSCLMKAENGSVFPFCAQFHSTDGRRRSIRHTASSQEQPPPPLHSELWSN